MFLYAAPLLSIILGWLAIVLTYLVDGWTKAFIYKRTKKTLKASLNDPEMSQQNKDEARKQLDALDKARVKGTVAGALKTLRSSSA